MGTAGALSLVKEFKTENILLLNADLLTNVDFEVMYNKLIDNKLEMVIASTKYKTNVPYAVFEFKNNFISNFEEKPTFVYHTNAGIYLFNKLLVDKIPKNSFYDITDLISDLISENYKLMHSPIKGYWIDIGKPTDYENAKEFMKTWKYEK